MRFSFCLCGLVLLGCGDVQAPRTEGTSSPPRETVLPGTTENPPDTTEKQPAPPKGPSSPEQESPATALPPDLRTRKTGSDWPAFLGPKATGVSSETGIIAPWPKEGLRLVWYKKLGTGYGMPAISRGRLFQFDRYGDQARLTCMNSETGKFIWKFEYPTKYEDYYGYNNGPRCFPVVDDDRVYTYGAEGMLHCVRAEDGKLVWKVDTKAEFGVVQNFFGVGCTPVIEGDLLIVQVGGSPKDSQELSPADVKKGNGSGVVAFDKRTGKVRYRVTNELASYAVPVFATIADRRWCFVLARGGLIGMDPANGKVDFQFPWRAKAPESVNASNPVVVGDRVFISETYGPGSALMEVKAGSPPKVLWSDADKPRGKSMQCHWNTPIYHDGYLYGCSGRNEPDAELRCIELATGKVMWKIDEFERTSLLMVDGHFICMDERGLLLLVKVNPKKYEEVSRTVIRNPADPDTLLIYKPCWAAPILAHGLLYIRGRDYLACLELIPEKK